MGEPILSVLMSVHDGARYLPAAMDSILAQTFRDFELIVVDDGSHDSSASILQRYEAADPRVRLLKRPHRGLAASLNEAFAEARGAYLARMDGDDIALPERFAQQLAFLESRPDVVCVGGAFDLLDAAGRRLTTLHPPLDDQTIQRELLKGHAAITHPAAMMRREALARVGGYDVRFDTAQDLDLWLRLGEIGALANLAEVVLQIRLHPDSVSETRGARQREMGRLACEEAWRRRGLSGMTYEAVEPWRPTKDRASRHRFALRYGWWAFQSGYRGTAMIYGAKAVAAMPLRREGWTLLVCAALKRPVREVG